MKAPLYLALLAACSGAESTDDDDSPKNPPPASSAEISECKDSCNQLKFFDCNDSVEQAGCYVDCDRATSSQIELFNGCVRTDICDPTCSTHIRPAMMMPVMSNPDDCNAACGRLAAEGCVPPDVAAGCRDLCAFGTVSDRGYILYCESRRTGCTLPAECEADPQVDPMEECKEGCDSLGFFSCISAPAQAMCRNLCDTVDETTRENFTACANSGACTGDDCYRLLDPSGSADVSGCRMACDNMSFFDCITPAELTDCRSTCGDASPEAIETFKACTAGICQDAACYLELKNG